MEETGKDKNKSAFGDYKTRESIDDETEDEEVKLNCIGGLRGCQDSDFSSDSEDEEEDMDPQQDEK